MTMNAVLATRRLVATSRSTISSSWSWVASRSARAAPTRNMAATTASTARCGRMRNRATPMVTAIATWTRKAPAAPSQTENGLPRVDNTRDANMVLSGSSPMKMIGKTATTTAKFTLTFLAGSKGSPSSRPRRHGRNEGLAHLPTGPVTGLLAEPACRPPIAGYSPSRTTLSDPRQANQAQGARDVDVGSGVYRIVKADCRFVVVGSDGVLCVADEHQRQVVR